MNENEMNQLENKLRSWQPRQASPKLKRKLFPGAATTHRTIALSLGWLAPAVACLLLALTIVSQEGSLSAGSRHGEPMMGLISSNLSYTNVLPGGRSQGRNRILPASFEWTNLSDYTSSISPF